jgi:hypothetical protein
MAHGYGDGLTTLYDEDGNPVTVRLENGAYVLATRDDKVVKVLERIEKRLEPKKASVWGRSAWKD